jgi:hypothetical protein
MALRVKREMIRPPPSGMMMAKEMRQILLQVESLADLLWAEGLDGFLFDILVFLFS